MKPIIFTLDDEPQVLNAVNRDLRQHYRGTYRIMKASSGAEALATVAQLKQRNAPVALFLVDQRMPEMSGTEFLTEAAKWYPDARKVLLTAYADTEAAITSINRLNLDYYLMKPWDPPELNLYPVLDDLLDDWLATVPQPYDGIRVLGTAWSAMSHHTKDFLSRNQIPYQWLDIERNAEARQLLTSLPHEAHQLPLVILPGGKMLYHPDDRTLAEHIGLQTSAKNPFYDLIIIGAGPAGLAAAVYGASEGLRTALIEKKATGGQAGTSSRIENYLGFPNGISGGDLARRAATQAKRLGAEILLAQEVVGIRQQGLSRGTREQYKIVQLSDGTQLSCHALIIATGVDTRQLRVPGIEKVTGAGVYYGAAVSEAANCKDGQVYVIGGANSAGQGAVFLAQYAKKVTMLVRGDTLTKSMSHYLIEQIEATPNIEVRTQVEVSAVSGEKQLETMTIRHRASGEQETVTADAMFIFIGAMPCTELVADVIERTPHGFIPTGPDLFVDGKRPKKWHLQRDPYLLETNVPGIFAVGDVREGAMRRVASAVGQGSVAVSFVHQYLKTV